MKIWILCKKEAIDKYENQRFLEVAKERGLNVKLVNPEDFDILVSKKGEQTLLYNGKKVKLPDCLIPRTGSGTTYFALAVIRQMKHMGVMVLNVDESIELSKDKLASFQALSDYQMPIPKTMLARSPLDIKTINRNFSYPIIVKTSTGSYGKGIFLCENKTQLNDLMDLIEVSKSPAVNAILQEFVSSSKGKDIRVFVVGGRAIAAMLRKAPKGKYKANYSAGGSVRDIKINSSMEWLASESARVMDLEIAGVDLLFDGKDYKVCEVNSAPGFEGLEKATGVNIPNEIYKYVELLIGANRRKKREAKKKV